MSLENSVKECCSGLLSMKATERKKSAEKLKDFLSGNAVPSMLSENTIKNKSITWSDVYNDINEFILKEVEKYETSKSFDSVIGPLCSSLLYICVSGANKGKAYIKCDIITDSSLLILKDKRLSRAIGDAYLNTIYKYILTNEHYLCFISAATWQEILDVSISVCLTNSSKLDDFTQLRLLYLVIKNGRYYCQFVIPLRNRLSKIEKCFHRVSYNEKKLQEFIVEIIVLLLDELSTESRTTVCEFSENVLPSLLKFYDQNIDDKKKSTLFKSLNMIVTLHHPEGRRFKENGSLANDWEIWNKYLQNMLEIITLEAIYIQKAKKPFDDPFKKQIYFHKLAAAVFYQTFHLKPDSNETDLDIGNTSKRQRISLNKHKKFNDIIDELQQNVVAWLGVVNMYLKKEGNNVTLEDYLRLSQIVQSFFSSGNINYDWKIIEELTCCIIKNILNLSSDRECPLEVLNIWHLCLRNTSSETNIHCASHNIMQYILKCNILNYSEVQHLNGMFKEKGIPVTDQSVSTLRLLINKFFSKCSQLSDRIRFFNWLTQVKLTLINFNDVKNILRIILSNQNILNHDNDYNNKRSTNLDFYDAIFNTNEKIMLLSDFEYDINGDNSIEQEVRTIEINNEINSIIHLYLEDNIKLFNEKQNKNCQEFQEFVKFIRILLFCIDISFDITSNGLFRSLKESIAAMYDLLKNILNGNFTILDKITALESVQCILIDDYNSKINVEVRRVNTDFLFCINNILNTPNENDENMYLDEDIDISHSALKRSCIILFASYCRKEVDYKNDILDLILDSKVYDFSLAYETDSAFLCIEILTNKQVDQQPFDLIFVLLKNICKDLYRHPTYTFKVLEKLEILLDYIWSKENLRKNCLIMLRGYVHRSDQLNYPPHVVGLLFRCVSKVIALNYKFDPYDIEIRDQLTDKSMNGVHSIRVYCGYLMKNIIKDFTDEEIESHLKGLQNMFVVDVSENKPEILRDETVNRTLCVLHSYYVISQTKTSIIHTIISNLILLITEKSLDKKLSKKVINKICKKITNKNIEEYLNKNILSILQTWNKNNKHFKELPMFLFGYNDFDEFLSKQYKWVLSADWLWNNNKNVGLLNLSNTLRESNESVIIEACFNYIMVLCLPYIVSEKYRLSNRPYVVLSSHILLSRNADKLFQHTRQVLDNEKWSCLLADNIGEIILMTVNLYRDTTQAENTFNIKLPQLDETFNSNKEIFEAILKYFGELIDGDLMEHLCENQPRIICKILFALWQNVIEEKIHEHIVLHLNTFVYFLNIIPFEFGTDSFVCNYACHSFIYAITDCNDKDNLRILTEAMRIALYKFLPNKVDTLRKPLLRLLSILLIKKEQGFYEDCSKLLNYLCEDMKDLLTDSDNVDMVLSLSQGRRSNNVCNKKAEFLHKLKSFKCELTSASQDMLINMKKFLKLNKQHVMKMFEDDNVKGFSKYCETNIGYQLINSLNNILKYCSDEKTVIEACQCLSEIGCYNLKTLVTVAPQATNNIVDMSPSQYFTIVVIKALSSCLFDEDPIVTKAISKTLCQLFQFQEGRDGLDLSDVNKDVLQPFVSPISKLKIDFKINDESFTLLSKERSWMPKEDENHFIWLKRLTSTLLDAFVCNKNYLITLRTVCILKADICQQILPSLMGLLVYRSNERVINSIGNEIRNFFSYYCDVINENNVENSNESVVLSRKILNVINYDKKMIMQYMLNCVDFVRLQAGHYRKRSSRMFNYLNLEYDKVAWAATIADQNLSAIFYGELWCIEKNSNVPPRSPDELTQIQGGENIQKIFRKCFVSIGEMDAIDGCGTAHLTIEEEKRKHLINTGQHTDALLLHDIALSCQNHTDTDLQYGIVRSLHKSGMHHLALQYMKALPDNDKINDLKYDCLSFLGDWSELIDMNALMEKSKQNDVKPQLLLKTYRYMCLKDCLNIANNNDIENKLIVPVNAARLVVSKLCQKIDMINCQNVYKIISYLHLFNDIQDYSLVRCEKVPMIDLIDNWQVEKLPPYNDFTHIETLISQRSLILEHAAKAYSVHAKDITTLQLKYTELGLVNHRIQIAQRLLAIVKKTQSSQEVMLVEGQISWAKGHKDIALSLLRNINENPSNNANLSAMSLRQYGMWMAETKYDNARDIINKYLKKGLDYLKKNDHSQTRLKVYHDVAKFADAEYKQVVTYMSSSSFENKLKCMENMKGTATSLKLTQSLSKDERKTLYTNEKLSALDEAEIESTKIEKEQFLDLAIRYYLLSLKESEENNLSVFRVISLWIENPCLVLNDAESGSFEDLLNAIPSRKFITVLPQLVPRLSNEKSLFAANLRKILTRCAKEHPHHTLPNLFSLKNSDKDKQILNASQSSTQKRRIVSQTVEPRVSAAAALVSQLARDDAALSIVISQMENMCNATISMANYVPKSKDSRQKIPSAEPISKLRDLDCIPIPTINIPIKQNCNYSDIQSLCYFENYFELVGGINCPKKIHCMGSNGQKRILLVKGQDDLRQDAVMQQVFNIVNTLLENDPVTSRNKLLIRTYKVVPMSQRSGVLEWCEGTIPLGTYLVGSNGAHSRFRPQDISPSAARSLMNSCYEGRKSNKDKLLVFMKILRELKPAFHHFFTEHFLDPVTWFERRQAYTKSVAASSMVGYILGLGDRHVQNILIDENTAEVIHIDFGIAFDHGKALLTPETIPFRLTQDMIAGFGSSGVEGVFRKCSEKTMQVLRDNQATLLTILEVLLCDPLYSWTVSTQQTNATQSNISGVYGSGKAGLAERALLLVSSKLCGTDGGGGGAVAVSGQVSRLIHTATDPANLSRLFPGWQPYL